MTLAADDRHHDGGARTGGVGLFDEAKGAGLGEVAGDQPPVAHGVDASSVDGRSSSRMMARVVVPAPMR